LRKTM